VGLQIACKLAAEGYWVYDFLPTMLVLRALLS
jgi:hypothetical protein